jgi:simple sugar transport system permease protein
MSVHALELFLQTAVQMGTHILLATVGAILCEKAGNLNLGVEGMMLLGAVTGFAAASRTASPALAILAAGLAGMGGALIYAVITVTLRGNQTVTGLVLTIFGTGVAGLIGNSLSGISLSAQVTSVFKAYDVPLLSKIPVLGPMLFSQGIFVQAALVVAVLAHIYLNKTAFGLNTRMVGENPAAADASGINVKWYKYANILAGGFLCGVGGAFLSVVYVPRWQNNITAGAGWIAVALVIFSTWSPLRAIVSAYLFGALRGLGFVMQNASVFGVPVRIPAQLLDMIPYLATIAMLILISLRRKRENQPPQSLGNPYFREER